MGNLRLCSGPWVSEFLDEAASFPVGPHDDQIDAMDDDELASAAGDSRGLPGHLNGGQLVDRR